LLNSIPQEIFIFNYLFIKTLKLLIHFDFSTNLINFFHYHIIIINLLDFLFHLKIKYKILKLFNIINLKFDNFYLILHIAKFINCN
jgi:hypothetical protein